jgi:hypothetical protein
MKTDDFYILSYPVITVVPLRSIQNIPVLNKQMESNFKKE